MIRSAIRRPVAVAMAYLALALFGVVAWAKIPVELLPDVELPRIRVTASWRGASPEATEALITSPLEAVVQQVRGVERVSSVSETNAGFGLAVVDVGFSRGTDMNFARLDLTERLASLATALPRGATPPRLEPYLPAQFAKHKGAFLRYTVTGPYTPEALRREVEDRLAPALRDIEGVADLIVDGGRARRIDVELDPARILALDVHPADVHREIGGLDLVREAGTIRVGGLDHTVTFRGAAGSIASLRRLPVLTDRGRVVRLGDIAVVRDTLEEPSSYYRSDGHPAVSFELAKEPGVNVLDVADRVKAHIASTRQTLTPGVQLILEADESRAMRAQLTDLRNRAVSSALVVFIVLLIALRSLRASAIIFVSIAASVLITLNLVFFGRLTLNVLTLMGFLMGFGLVIDNAVVVLENIERRYRAGDSIEAAAERGAREMFLPVLAATATTIIVFFPFVYLQGEAQLFYIPLALVVGFTNVASLFVTFTLTPALAGRFLRVPAPRGHAPTRTSWVLGLYSALVAGILRHPWFAVLTAVAALGGSAYLFERNVSRGSVWRPWAEQDTYIQIALDLPPGEELAHTDELARAVESRLRSFPGMGRVITHVHPHAAQIRLVFTDSLRDTGIPIGIKHQMEAYSQSLGGVDAHVHGFGPSFSGTSGAPPSYSIEVRGYNFERVRDIADDLADRLRRFARVRDVDTNASGPWFSRVRSTEVVLRLDRSRLAVHRLPARDVVDRVRAVVGGEPTHQVVTLGNSEVAFSVHISEYQRVDDRSLKELLIPSRGGAAVRLGDVAELEKRETMARIVRENQQYQRTITYEFVGPAKLARRVQESILGATEVPPGYTISAGEEGKWDENEKTSILGVFVLSMVLVFMVTAALFESVRQPFCVLLTVPMALVGVFLVFYFTGAAFTREALIGVIMMGGVVVNNAALLVDHINHLRRQDSMPLADAVHRGTLERVRPILITSALTIFALLPLVIFSEAADSSIWNAMSYSLLGGLCSSTALVLTVTPALYLILERGGPTTGG